MKLKSLFKRAVVLAPLFVIGVGVSLSFQNCTGGFEGLNSLDAALGSAEHDLLQANSADLESLGRVSLSNSGSAPKVGIAYMVWHCLANDPTRNKVISEAQRTGNWGSIPEFHWREVPAATNSITTYCATNKNLVRSHFELLEAAKIDFLIVDFTNQSYLPGAPEEAAPQSMIDGFKNLLDVSVERGGKIKIIPWVSFKGNLHTYFLKMMGLLPRQNPNPYEQAVFLFQGKPLIIASWDKGRQQDNVASAIATVEAAGITVRKMWALHRGSLRDSSGTSVWSFMEQCQSGFRESQGNIECGQYVHPEIASVSAAYQETFMTDFRTAVPKFSGRTFLKQLKTAQSSGAPLIILNTWNEWIAQRFCLKDNVPTHLCYGSDGSPINQHFPFNGRPVFVDAFDREYSRDFEPDTAGSEYYVLMKNAIAQLKDGSSGSTVCSPNSTADCPITNGVGQKTCNSAGSGYGTCAPISCNAGYSLSNGQCVVAQVCSPYSSTSCAVTNGTGQKTCNSVGSGYGTCAATSCSLGYVVSNGQCMLSSAYSDVKTVVAYVGGVVGQTGTWWCENHFGKNLGGNWLCLAGSCSSTVSVNQSITCARRK